MFYLGGVAIAVFLTLLLLSKSNKVVADKILAGWLFVLTVHLLLFYFYKSEQYPQLLGVSIPLPLLHGPFLYLYTRSVTNQGLSWKISLLHFIPGVAIFLYLIPFISLPAEQKVFVFKNNGIGYETFSLINLILIIISGVFYVILSMVALRKHRVSIENQFSSTEKINLKWLQYLIYWIGAIWLIVIVGNDDLVFAATVLFISFIGFFGIKQVGIFNSQKVAPLTGIEANTIIKEGIEDNIQAEPEKGLEKRKYQKSGLDTDTSESLHHKLAELMMSEKLFRENELSLADLAKRLDTQPNYLSQVINEREGKNFYDYINTMRIEEFKRLAASPESRKYTLLALAEECGFNSKSSFNRYFKKVTGQSPSEFMQSVSETAY